MKMGRPQCETACFHTVHRFFWRPSGFGFSSSSRDVGGTRTFRRGTMWLTRGLVSFSRRPVGIQRYVTKDTQCNLLESTKQYSVGWLGKSAAVVFVTADTILHDGGRRLGAACQVPSDTHARPSTTIVSEGAEEHLRGPVVAQFLHLHLRHVLTRKTVEEHLLHKILGLIGRQRPVVKMTDVVRCQLRRQRRSEILWWRRGTKLRGRVQDLMV